MLNRKRGIGSQFNDIPVNSEPNSDEQLDLRDNTKWRLGLGSRISDAYTGLEINEIEDFSPPWDPPPPPPEDPPEDPIYRDATGREITYEEWLKIQAEREAERERWRRLEEAERERWRRLEELAYSNYYYEQYLLGRQAEAELNRRTKGTGVPGHNWRDTFGTPKELSGDAPLEYWPTRDQMNADLNRLINAKELERTEDPMVKGGATDFSGWEHDDGGISDLERVIRKKLDKIPGDGPRIANWLNTIRNTFPEDLYRDLLKRLEGLTPDEIKSILLGLIELLDKLAEDGVIIIGKRALDLLKRAPIIALLLEVLTKMKENNGYKDNPSQFVRDLINAIVNGIFPFYRNEEDKIDMFNPENDVVDGILKVGDTIRDFLKKTMRTIWHRMHYRPLGRPSLPILPRLLFKR